MKFGYVTMNSAAGVRPDVLARVLETGTEIEALRLANQQAGREEPKDATQFDEKSHVYRRIINIVRCEKLLNYQTAVNDYSRAMDKPQLPATSGRVVSDLLPRPACRALDKNQRPHILPPHEIAVGFRHPVRRPHCDCFR